MPNQHGPRRHHILLPCEQVISPFWSAPLLRDTSLTLPLLLAVVSLAACGQQVPPSTSVERNEPASIDPVVAALRNRGRAALDDGSGASAFDNEIAIRFPSQAVCGRRLAQPTQPERYYVSTETGVHGVASKDDRLWQEACSGGVAIPPSD